MGGYRHVLLAVDFEPGHEKVVARAVDICQRYHSRLTLLHVVEPAPVDVSTDSLPALAPQLEQEYLDAARRRLSAVRKRTGLHDVDELVRLGHTKREILHQASALGADLIVIGCHGRHGLALLLGSTANAVLHGTPCDVLAVRI